MSQIWVALISAVLGGVGLKLIDTFFLSKEKKADVASEFRDELREEMKAQREEIKLLRADIDKWKLRYYGLLELIAKHDIEIPDNLKNF
jgi:hypothetical protein